MSSRFSPYTGIRLYFVSRMTWRRSATAAAAEMDTTSGRGVITSRTRVSEKRPRASARRFSSASCTGGGGSSGTVGAPASSSSSTPGPPAPQPSDHRGQRPGPDVEGGQQAEERALRVLMHQDVGHAHPEEQQVDHHRRERGEHRPVGHQVEEERRDDHGHADVRGVGARCGRASAGAAGPRGRRRPAPPWRSSWWVTWASRRRLSRWKEASTEARKIDSPARRSRTRTSSQIMPDPEAGRAAAAPGGPSCRRRSRGRSPRTCRKPCRARTSSSRGTLCAQAAGVARRGRDADHDVTETLFSPRPRKRQDVGRPVLAPVVAVEAPQQPVSGQHDRDLAAHAERPPRPPQHPPQAGGVDPLAPLAVQDDHRQLGTRGPTLLLLGRLVAAPRLVGQDDRLDEPVPHHVLLVEVAGRRSPPPRRAPRSPRRAPRRGPDGRSIWVMSPVTTTFEPKPTRVSTIFICSVVVFWASSMITNASERVRPRMKAMGATSIWLRSKSRSTFSKLQQVVERVVERPQVGVDLLLQVAGQEAELLPRLDRGPGEDDAAHLAVEQAGDGLGHRQVGLAGSRGADAEDHVVASGSARGSAAG